MTKMENDEGKGKGGKESRGLLDRKGTSRHDDRKIGRI
jgi:hypothetical protein